MRRISRKVKRKINKAQEIMFDLIRLARFNNFEPDKILRDLINHKELWISVVIGNISETNLIVLRDIPRGHINLDKLYILCRKENVDKIAELANNWNPDEMWWLTQEEKEHALGMDPIKDLEVLVLWWD